MENHHSLDLIYNVIVQQLIKFTIYVILKQNISLEGKHLDFIGA